MRKLTTDISLPPITAEFRQFVIDTLLYRCLLKPETVSKYFDTPEGDGTTGMELMMQSFVHKSYSRDTNYELLELEGDVILNACTLAYIRGRYPDIVSVKWVTRLKHTLVSGKVLAIVALKHGFQKFAVYGEKIKSQMEEVDNIEDCEACMKMYEDIIEGFCGAITKILDANVGKGVGYAACYNLIESFLDEYDIPLEYDKLFDSVTRLKEFYDNLKWPNFKKNVYVTELTDAAKRVYLDNVGRRPDEAILNSTDRHIAFVYAYTKGEKNKRVLVAAATSNVKGNAKKIAAEKAIGILKSFDYQMPVVVAPTQRYKEGDADTGEEED
jgi:dsRNA-specific ribonuclease